MCNDPRKHGTRESRKSLLLQDLQNAKAPAAEIQLALKLFDIAEDAEEAVSSYKASKGVKVVETRDPILGYEALVEALGTGSASLLQQQMALHVIHDAMKELKRAADPLDGLLEALMGGNVDVKVVSLGGSKDDLPPFMKPLPKKETLH